MRYSPDTVLQKLLPSSSIFFYETQMDKYFYFYFWFQRNPNFFPRVIFYWHWLQINLDSITSCTHKNKLPWKIISSSKSTPCFGTIVWICQTTTKLCVGKSRWQTFNTKSVLRQTKRWGEGKKIVCSHWNICKLISTRYINMLPLFHLQNEMRETFSTDKKLFFLLFCVSLSSFLNTNHKNPKKDDDEKLPEDEKRKINIPSISAAQKI